MILPDTKCRYYDKYDPCFPCFDGSPIVGEHSLKEHTTVVDRQVYTKYACGFTANKVSIKRSLNLSHNSQYHVCIMIFTKSCKRVPPFLKSFLTFLFLFSCMVYTARERCGMMHDCSLWHIVSVLILSVLVITWRYMIFATGGRCDLIHDNRHGEISFQHRSNCISPPSSISLSYLILWYMWYIIILDNIPW